MKEKTKHFPIKLKTIVLMYKFLIIFNKNCHFHKKRTAHQQGEHKNKKRNS